MRRHWRFYVAAAIGLAVALALTGHGPAVRAVAGGDAFFASYLALAAVFLLRTGQAGFEAHIAEADEGVALVSLITAIAVAVSLGAIVALVAGPTGEGPPQLLVAAVSLPLAWATLHTVAAFHYASLFASGGGGLAFPETPHPGAVEFLYFAFVIGVAAQVSDVQVTSTAMRRAVLIHGTGAFFFNAVLIALAVNALLGTG